MQYGVRWIWHVVVMSLGSVPMYNNLFVSISSVHVLRLIFLNGQEGLTVLSIICDRFFDCFMSFLSAFLIAFCRTFNTRILRCTASLVFQGDLDIYSKTASKYDDCRLLRLPNIRLGFVIITI